MGKDDFVLCYIYDSEMASKNYPIVRRICFFTIKDFIKDPDPNILMARVELKDPYRRLFRIENGKSSFLRTADIGYEDASNRFKSWREQFPDYIG